MRALLAGLCVALLAPRAEAVQKRILFDNAHAETAGNADWQIDTDQPFPRPVQSTVTQATPRTYWLGAISSWGIDMVKRGYFVASLPAAHGVTYGVLNDSLDLSFYDVFVVDEPNIRFTAAEAAAIFSYVHDGGGLVAVSDHDISDRNNDGFDSPRIWDRLDPNHFFGAHFDTTGEVNNNITQVSSNVDPAPNDSIIHGPNGFANALEFHNGTTMVLYPSVNPSVRGKVWMTGVPTGSTTGVMAAVSTYGKGHVFLVGDSSPCDDGSATAGNTSIFDGWAEAAGADSLLFQNATQWVTRRSGVDTASPTVVVAVPNGAETWFAGSLHTITWTASDNVGVTSVDVDYSLQGPAGPWLTVQHGAANSGTATWTLPAQTSDNAFVRVAAFDAAANVGTDASNALFHITPNPSALPDAAPGARFALERPAANPARGHVGLRFSLPANGAAHIEIVDVSGERIWSWSEANVTAGEHQAIWTGRTSNGARAPAGMYFVRLTAPVGSRTQRFAFLP